jgi:4-methyl-5(b-hydroxyethyl)-thiazole monophosphate biosynthesis
MTRAAVLLAPGFEELEAVTVIDVLRRGEVEVTILGVGAARVTGNHGIELGADRRLDEARDDHFDLVVLPGGMPGAGRLRDDPGVQSFLIRHASAGAELAAICAAPIALAHAGLLEGRAATAYPTFKDQLGAARYQERPVVSDGAITTSRGPGTALEFALTLVERMKGSTVRRQVAERMLLPQPGV